MKAALLLSLAVLNAGCFITTVRKTTSVDAGTVESAPRQGALGTLTLDASAASSTLMISALRPRECTRNVYRVTELRIGKTATMDAIDLGGGGGGGGGSPLAAVYLFIGGAMAVTGVISGTITVIELAVDSEKVERQATLSGVRRYPCPVVASELPFDVVLASGTRLSGVTDRMGQARIEIPAGEPEHGSATVRADNAQFLVSYARSPNPTCTSARLAMFDRINSEPGAVRRAALVHATPSCSTSPAEDTLWKLTQQAALASIEGNCIKSRELAFEVARLDANHYRSVFLKHAAIARCR